MLRRLHSDQPDAFAFTPKNHAWAEAQITKYPEGRQASAVIPLLWRAQEQEGWLSRPAIEHVAAMLDMAYIRVLEVATFYFMFQLQPVGSVANIQICGTTSCMICGAEDLVAVCKEKIAERPHMLSEDGKFSWEEVECLGACANAPMAQIGKDYYEDLTVARLGEIIEELRAGKVPVPGPQNGRYAAEPLSGLTSLTDFDSGKTQYNASAQLAVDLGDTVKRIDGSEQALVTPWLRSDAEPAAGGVGSDVGAPEASEGAGEAVRESAAPERESEGVADAVSDDVAPEAARDSAAPEAVSDSAVPEAVSDSAVPETVSDGDASDDTPVAPADAPTPVAEAPSAEAPVASETAPAESVAAARPEGLDAARAGGPNDLKKIKGVGPKLEQLLFTLGFYHFDQIAAWGPEEVAWVDDNLQGFKGRVSRDNWVAQAAQLAAGGETEFSKRVEDGDVY